MLRNILVVILLTAALPILASSPKDSTNKTKIPDSLRLWKIHGETALRFNQITLTNWAKGGESSLAGKATANLDFDYKKGKYSFDNNISLMYGLVGQKGTKVQKTDDKIDLSSTLAWEAFKNWSYSSFFNLKTQFANGYKYPDDSTLISTFFAPAFLTTSLGMQYKPNKHFAFLISPASGKFIIVANQELADKGAFGVTPAVIDDSTGAVLEKGKNYKAEFGINVVLKFKKEILKNIVAESKLNLYNNYLDELKTNRWNIDFDWESNVSFEVNDHFSTDLYIHMIYDHNTMIPIYEMQNGERVKIGEGPRLQFKESFGIGLSYKF